MEFWEISTLGTSYGLVVLLVSQDQHYLSNRFLKILICKLNQLDFAFFDITHVLLFTLLHPVSRITHAVASKCFIPYNIALLSFDIYTISVI